MNSFYLNALVGSNSDTIASVNDQDEKTTTLFNTFTFSHLDIWLFIVSFIGLVVLALVIFSVIKFNKNKNLPKDTK